MHQGARTFDDISYRSIDVATVAPPGATVFASCRPFWAEPRPESRLRVDLAPNPTGRQNRPTRFLTLSVTDVVVSYGIPAARRCYRRALEPRRDVPHLQTPLAFHCCPPECKPQHPLEPVQALSLNK